jgi:hypothetical protein
MDKELRVIKLVINEKDIEGVYDKLHDKKPFYDFIWIPMGTKNGCNERELQKLRNDNTIPKF